MDSTEFRDLARTSAVLATFVLLSLVAGWIAYG